MHATEAYASSATHKHAPMQEAGAQQAAAEQDAPQLQLAGEEYVYGVPVPGEGEKEADGKGGERLKYVSRPKHPVRHATLSVHDFGAGTFCTRADVHEQEGSYQDQNIHCTYTYVRYRHLYIDCTG